LRLFQGLKANRLKNWEPFPVEPSSIDAVLLTHAHVDHIGYLPRLVKDGFRGPIHCTTPRRTLRVILLLDTAHLQEEEARFANKPRLQRSTARPNRSSGARTRRESPAVAQSPPLSARTLSRRRASAPSTATPGTSSERPSST
jgi:Cft2 family RNA processing exonuclease